MGKATEEVHSMEEDTYNTEEEGNMEADMGFVKLDEEETVEFILIFI